MPVLAAALALALPFLGHAPHTPSRPTTQVYGVGRWRLAVTQDPFAQSTACTLRLGGARVERGRLIWPLGRGAPTGLAVYRVDGGPPRLQDALLIPASANLTNPSNGVVVVPVSEIGGGRALEVRATPRSHVHSLPVAGLDQALAAARRVGCAADPVAPDAPPIL